MSETACGPDANALLSGGCQCGLIRYRLNSRPEGAHLCHCRMCQKAVGNAFAALAPVRKGDLAWTRGSPAFFRSSSHSMRGFCRDCGTPLSFAYLDSEWIDITIGSLDQPGDTPPLVHYGVESMLPWLALGDDRPRRPTGEATHEISLDGLKGYQHPDHETEAWPLRSLD